MAKRKMGHPSLVALRDEQGGPLAEAQALADLLEVIAVDNAQLRDNSLAVLSHMIVDRLAQVRATVEHAEVAHG